jgi:hypothetical protein
MRIQEVQKHHSWAMPDLSVTSGTELNPDAGKPKQEADAGLGQLTTGRNADAGLTFLRHLRMIYISPIPECSGIGLKCRMPECQCRRR